MRFALDYSHTTEVITPYVVMTMMMPLRLLKDFFAKEPLNVTTLSSIKLTSNYNGTIIHVLNLR